MTDGPMDPTNYGDDGPTEFSWGAGIFPPGVASNEGQSRAQDDFGENMVPPTNTIDDDAYARAVADRRTDPTDPDSNRDFESLGNPDRYGKQPPLVRAEPQRNSSQNPDRYGTERKPLERGW